MERTTQKKPTQEKAILEHLRKFGTITPLEALKICGSFRLSGRIFNLRKQGYRIATETETDGAGKYWARYRLLENKGA